MREGNVVSFCPFFVSSLFVDHGFTRYLALFALSLSGVAVAAHYLHACVSPSLQLVRAARLVASSSRRRHLLSIRQHTAYVSIRQHIVASSSRHRHLLSIRQHTSAYRASWCVLCCDTCSLEFSTLVASSSRPRLRQQYADTYIAAPDCYI